MRRRCRHAECRGVGVSVGGALSGRGNGPVGLGAGFRVRPDRGTHDGGVSAGLPRPIASALAAQTVRGAAEMVLVLGEHPAVLKERVASPGGTTMAGLQALEAHGLRAAAMAAVVAAANRAREMGREAQ